MKKVYILLLICLIALTPVMAQQTYSNAQKKVAARRSAILDGYRQLSEAIQGVHITSETTVKDLTTEDDKLSIEMESTVIRGASVLDTRFSEDNICEVDMEIRISDLILFLMSNNSNTSQKIDYQAMLDANPEDTIRVTGMGSPLEDKTKEDLEREAQARANSQINYAQTTKENESLKQENAKLQEQLSQLQQTTTQTKTLQNENAALQQQVNQLQQTTTQLQNLRAENVALQQQVNQLQQVSLQLQNLQSENKNLKADNQLLQQRIKQLQEENAKLIQESQNTSQQWKNTQYNYNARQTEVQQLNTKVKQLQSDLQTMQFNNTQLQTKVSQLQDQNTQLQNQNLQLQDKSLQLQQIPKLEAKNNELQNQISQLQSTNFQLQNQVLELESKNNTPSDAYISLTNENEKLNSKVQELEVLNEQLTNENEQLKNNQYNNSYNQESSRPDYPWGQHNGSWNSNQPRSFVEHLQEENERLRQENNQLRMQLEQRQPGHRRPDFNAPGRNRRMFNSVEQLQSIQNKGMELGREKMISTVYALKVDDRTTLENWISSNSKLKNAVDQAIQNNMVVKQTPKRLNDYEYEMIFTLPVNTIIQALENNIETTPDKGVFNKLLKLNINRNTPNIRKLQSFKNNNSRISNIIAIINIPVNY